MTEEKTALARTKTEKAPGGKKRKNEIKAVSYVHVGDQLVNTDDLTPEQRKTLAAWLKKTYLNALFEGKAVFYASEQEKQEAAGKGVKA